MFISILSSDNYSYQNLMNTAFYFKKKSLNLALVHNKKNID